MLTLSGHFTLSVLNQAYRCAGAPQVHSRRGGCTGRIDAVHTMQSALSRNIQSPRYPNFNLALEKVPVYIIGWLQPHLGFAGF